MFAALQSSSSGWEPGGRRRRPGAAVDPHGLALEPAFRRPALRSRSPPSKPGFTLVVARGAGCRMQAAGLGNGGDVETFLQVLAAPQRLLSRTVIVWYAQLVRSTRHLVLGSGGTQPADRDIEHQPKAMTPLVENRRFPRMGEEVGSHPGRGRTTAFRSRLIADHSAERQAHGRSRGTERAVFSPPPPRCSRSLRGKRSSASGWT